MAAPQVLQVWIPPKAVGGHVDVGGSLTAEFEITYRVRYDKVHHNFPLLMDADASEVDDVEEGYDLAIPPFDDTIGDYHLLAKKPQRTDDPRVWDVVCTYRLPSPGQESRPTDGDDSDVWAVQVDITTVPLDYEMQRDASGKLIVNKVGDAVSGVIIQKKVERITIGFSCVTVPWSDIDAMFGPEGSGCTNSEEFSLWIEGQEREFDDETVHFEDYTLTYRKDPNGSTYPRLQFILGWRPDGWKRLIANKGFNEKIGGVLKPIMNGGSKLSSPVYLKTSDDDQVKASPGDPVEDISSDGLGTVLYQHVDIGAIMERLDVGAP